jgi:hypothetical protein
MWRKMTDLECRSRKRLGRIEIVILVMMLCWFAAGACLLKLAIFKCGGN